MEPPRPARTTKQLPGGFRLKHFEVLELIATGGMGTVYRAMDQSARRTVALKVLRAEFSSHEDYVRMFEDEIYSLARLCHPNIVPIYYAGQEGEWLFFAMPLIEGKDCLKILAESGPCEAARVKKWALQSVSALSAAWRCGIMHRDLKPANIIIESTNGSALLADFGLAMIRGVESSPLADDWGSPGYLAPEQILKEDVDFRTDMYALGASLFHILAGQTPYASKDWRDEIEGHTSKPFPFHLAHLRGLTDRWTSILARMMEKKPADRFENYEALADAIRAVDQPLPVKGHTRGRPGAVPSRLEWPRERLNGLLRKDAPFWSGIDPGQVVSAGPGVVVSVKEWPPLISLAPWEWHIRQICEGGEGDPVQLVEFSKIMPEYSEFVIGLASTGLYGSADGSFETAMTGVGLARCRVLAATCVLVFEGSKASRYFDWLPLWKHSISCGLLAELLLEFFGFPADPNTLAAGILHDIGKVILGDIAGMGLMAAFRRSLLEGIPLAQCEGENLPCGHARAGEMYARHLKLPPRVIDGIGLHHGEIPKREGHVVAAIQAANDLCKRYALGYSGEGVLLNSGVADCQALRWLVENRISEEKTMAEFQIQFEPLMKTFPVLADQWVDHRRALMGEPEIIPFWKME